ncbi:MAG: hypothetical protein ACK4PR_03460, partial [Gammaproteobacteria bacterium]
SSYCLNALLSLTDELFIKDNLLPYLEIWLKREEVKSGVPATSEQAKNSPPCLFIEQLKSGEFLPFLQLNYIEAQGYATEEEGESGHRHEAAIELVNTEQPEIITHILQLILYKKETSLTKKMALLYTLSKRNEYNDLIYDVLVKILEDEEKVNFLYDNVGGVTPINDFLFLFKKLQLDEEKKQKLFSLFYNAVNKSFIKINNFQLSYDEDKYKMLLEKFTINFLESLLLLSRWCQTEHQLSQITKLLAYFQPIMTTREKEGWWNEAKFLAIRQDIKSILEYLKVDNNPEKQRIALSALCDLNFPLITHLLEEVCSSTDELFQLLAGANNKITQYFLCPLLYDFTVWKGESRQTVPLLLDVLKKFQPCSPIKYLIKIWNYRNELLAGYESDLIEALNCKINVDCYVNNIIGLMFHMKLISSVLIKSFLELAITLQEINSLTEKRGLYSFEDSYYAVRHIIFLLNNYDLTDLLYEVAQVIKKAPHTYSILLLKKTPCSKILEFRDKSTSLYLFAYKVMSEKQVFWIENKSLYFFENSQLIIHLLDNEASSILESHLTEWEKNFTITDFPAQLQSVNQSAFFPFLIDPNIKLENNEKNESQECNSLENHMGALVEVKGRVERLVRATAICMPATISISKEGIATNAQAFAIGTLDPSLSETSKKALLEKVIDYALGEADPVIKTIQEQLSFLREKLRQPNLSNEIELVFYNKIEQHMLLLKEYYINKQEQRSASTIPGSFFNQGSMSQSVQNKEQVYEKKESTYGY